VPGARCPVLGARRIGGQVASELRLAFPEHGLWVRTGALPGGRAELAAVDGTFDDVPGIECAVRHPREGCLACPRG
jgi:hypothetical protein